ncbi:MAG: AI-2E family transporter [Mogibacterium sp.]|nr:AI-2E family transporter [Mogibacterium sp.]
MFRKFRQSPYAKAAVLILVCGGLLIIFNNWITKNRISIGFENINSTLAPIYIGGILAFILCPVYNACVKWSYQRLLTGAMQKDAPAGIMPVYEDDKLAVSKEEKRNLLGAARAVATLVCVIVVVGLAGLFIYFVVPQVVASAFNLVNTMPERLTSFSNWCHVHLSHFPFIAVWVDNLANAENSEVMQWIQEHILSGNAASIASMVSNGVIMAVKYVANAFIGLLIMVYLLNYKERLFAITRKIVNATCSQKRKATLYEFANIVNETFIGFIVGRIIDSFIIGVLTYIVLKICDMPFALMLSLIVGVTNVIPFFGPFIGAIPSVFILLLENPIDALYFVIIIIVIQQLDGNLIGPKIVGNAIGIGSFWVLISVLIGGGLFGFPGMALGVPVFAVFYRYADKLMTNSLKRKEKNTHTSYYYSLEPYGLEDDEVELEPSKKKQQSLYSRLRKGTKDLSHNKFAYDHNDHVSNLDRDTDKLAEVKGKEQDLLE